MKLNIYNGNEVVKTYETKTFLLKWRLSKKLLKLIDIGQLSKFESATLEELINMIQPIITDADELVSEILVDMFPGITQEEIDNTDTTEICICVVNAFKFVVNKFKSLSGKNQ